MRLISKHLFTSIVLFLISVLTYSIKTDHTSLKVLDPIVFKKENSNPTIKRSIASVPQPFKLKNRRFFITKKNKVFLRFKPDKKNEEPNKTETSDIEIEPFSFLTEDTSTQKTEDLEIEPPPEYIKNEELLFLFDYEDTEKKVDEQNARAHGEVLVGANFYSFTGIDNENGSRGTLVSSLSPSLSLLIGVPIAYKTSFSLTYGLDQVNLRQLNGRNLIQNDKNANSITLSITRSLWNQLSLSLGITAAESFYYKCPDYLSIEAYKSLSKGFNFSFQLLNYNYGIYSFFPKVEYTYLKESESTIKEMHSLSSRILIGPNTSKTSWKIGGQINYKWKGTNFVNIEETQIGLLLGFGF